MVRDRKLEMGLSKTPHLEDRDFASPNTEHIPAERHTASVGLTSHASCLLQLVPRSTTYMSPGYLHDLKEKMIHQTNTFLHYSMIQDWIAEAHCRCFGPCAGVIPVHSSVALRSIRCSLLVSVVWHFSIIAVKFPAICATVALLWDLTEHSTVTIQCPHASMSLGRSWPSSGSSLLWSVLVGTNHMM